MVEDFKDPMTVFSEFISRKRLKMTPQRLHILEVFLSSHGHLTAEELYRKVKEGNASIGQATVYRTVKLLADSGLAKEVEFGDGVVRYELKYGQSHHDHLICERCGRNVEVVDAAIEKAPGGGRGAPRLRAYRAQAVICTGCVPMPQGRSDHGLGGVPERIRRHF
jgi:Fur family ferric uptake transcriptional regulator